MRQRAIATADCRSCGRNLSRPPSPSLCLSALCVCVSGSSGGKRNAKGKYQPGGARSFTGTAPGWRQGPAINMEQKVRRDDEQSSSSSSSGGGGGRDQPAARSADRRLMGAALHCRCAPPLCVCAAVRPVDGERVVPRAGRAHALHARPLRRSNHSKTNVRSTRGAGARRRTAVALTLTHCAPTRPLAESRLAP